MFRNNLTTQQRAAFLVWPLFFDEIISVYRSALAAWVGYHRDKRILIPARKNAAFFKKRSVFQKTPVLTPAFLINPRPTGIYQITKPDSGDKQSPFN